MLLLSTLLFMPSHPRPRGAAVDSGLFSTFSLRISEHFTKTGSLPQSAFVKEATTLSPQMSPGSWEPSLRGCQYFLQVTGIHSLSWTETFTCGEPGFAQKCGWRSIRKPCPDSVVVVGGLWLGLFFPLLCSSEDLQEYTPNWTGFLCRRQQKETKGDFGFTYSLWTVFSMRMFMFYLKDRKKCSRHLIFQSRLNRAKFLSYGRTFGACFVPKYTDFFFMLASNFY